MSTDPAVEDLEAALLRRANTLADEYLTRARQVRERILEEENERLKLREERETLTAKAMADRLFRRTVQANELHLRAKLDKLRWDLVHAVMQSLTRRLEVLSDDEAEYFPLLRTLLMQGVHAIGQSELVAEINERDFTRLANRQRELVGDGLPGVSIELAVLARGVIGGVLVRNKEATVRVDNTFEGRIERLEDDLHQVILERLFPRSADMELFLRG